MLIALAKIPEREGSISPSRFYGQLSDVEPLLSTYKIIFLFISGAAETNEDAGGI